MNKLMKLRKEEDEIEEEEEKQQEKEIKEAKITHQKGDIEPITQIIGLRVWQNSKKYIDFPVEQAGLAELASLIIKNIDIEEE